MEDAPSWQHLVPYVDTLVAAGSELVRAGFEPDQGGWDCWLRDRLDVSLLRPLVDSGPHADKIWPDASRLDCLHFWASVRSDLDQDTAARPAVPGQRPRSRQTP